MFSVPKNEQVLAFLSQKHFDLMHGFFFVKLKQSTVGASVPATVGADEIVGRLEGIAERATVGAPDRVGAELGRGEGSRVGLPVGVSVGAIVVGETVGGCDVQNDKAKVCQ